MQTYDQHGIRFSYPDDWTLDQDEPAQPGDSVAVYSPGGAFWLVSPQAEDTEPAELADEALAAMREEYSDLESEPVEEWIAGQPAVGYDVNFWYLDLTATSLIRCLSTEQGSFVILCQSEDREFEQVEPVFQAITTSLIGVPE